MCAGQCKWNVEANRDGSSSSLQRRAHWLPAVTILLCRPHSRLVTNYITINNCFIVRSDVVQINSAMKTETADYFVDIHYCRYRLVSFGKYHEYIPGIHAPACCWYWWWHFMLPRKPDCGFMMIRYDVWCPKPRSIYKSFTHQFWLTAACIQIIRELWWTCAHMCLRMAWGSWTVKACLVKGGGWWRKDSFRIFLPVLKLVFDLERIAVQKYMVCQMLYDLLRSSSANLLVLNFWTNGVLDLFHTIFILFCGSALFLQKPGRNIVKEIFDLCYKYFAESTRICIYGEYIFKWNETLVLL